MPKVNPDILIWAREKAGLTIDEAVERLDMPDARGVLAANRLRELETGKTEPSRPLLIRMAKLYRRPLLLFYMTKPPLKGDRGQDFRTLPADYSATDEGLIDALIRNVLARQSVLRAALEDEDDIEAVEFVNSMSMKDGVLKVLALLRALLQVDHKNFYSQSDPDRAFTLLRSRAESAGVFVLLIGDLGNHHTKIDLELFRGFALADKLVPFIVINDHDNHSAWSFTLLHELVHIIIGQSGISGAVNEQVVEKFCNEVAGEFLLPTEEIKEMNPNNLRIFDDAKDEILYFAMRRNLSNSMVAYKLFLQGAIDLTMWTRLSQFFRELWLNARDEKKFRAVENKDGPSYYIVRKHRVGKTLINLVSQMMRNGTITTTKAGQILGVKAKNVHHLMEA